MSGRNEELALRAQGMYAGIGELLKASGFEPALAGEICRESLERFKEVLKVMPEGGGAEDRLTGILESAAILLGFYLAWKSRGKKPGDAGKITYEMVEFYYRSREISGMEEKATQESIASDVRSLKESSGKPGWPGGWVMEYLDSAGTGFDMCWNNNECGIISLFEKFGAREYVRFLCAMDSIYYPARGLGLTRTKTLVDSDCCDFRVKLGGVTTLERETAKMLKEWGKIA
jgi:hypothetical protein